MEAAAQVPPGVDGLLSPPPISTVGAVPRRLLHEEVADQLRSAIIRGEFRPGQRLREPELAGMLHTSRGPVREALRKLEQEGLVALSPHQGASVVAIDAIGLEEALAIRHSIEELNGRSVLARATPRDLTELDACVESLSRAVDARDAAGSNEFDLQFHERLIDIGASEVVRRVWNVLIGPMRLYLGESNRAMVRSGSNLTHSHRAIAESLRAGDERGMMLAFAQHFAETRESLRNAGTDAEASDGVEDGSQVMMAAGLEAY